MNQVDIKDRYLKVKAELKRVEDEGTQFLYATKTKYFPKVGHVHEMTFQELLTAQKVLNNLNSSDMKAEMEQLGLTDEDLNVSEQTKYLGIKLDIWTSDFKTRIEEIKEEARINTLRSDLKILKRHLDSDSVRDMDLAKLSNITL